MQNKILFVGDSHSAGYWTDTLNNVHFGDENCYGRIYAEKISSSVVYADPGAPNSVYPRWIANMLKTYPVIDKVVIQTTHWDRWKLACSSELGFAHLPINYFTATHEETENFIFHTDYSNRDSSVVEWNEKIKFNNLENGNQKWPAYWAPRDWPGDSQEYYKTSAHHQVLTHLTYENYCKDIALIDSICAEKNIQVYVWRINDYVELPNTKDTFRKLTHTKFFKPSAQSWIKNNLDIDISKMLKDVVHYNKEAHNIIATKFIPEVLKAKPLEQV